MPEPRSVAPPPTTFARRKLVAGMIGLLCSCAGCAKRSIGRCVRPPASTFSFAPDERGKAPAMGTPGAGCHRADRTGFGGGRNAAPPFEQTRANCGRQRCGCAATAAAAPAGIPDRRRDQIEGGGADRDELLTAALVVGAFAELPGPLGRGPDRRSPFRVRPGCAGIPRAESVPTCRPGKSKSCPWPCGRESGRRRCA
jgi:hypothetical protein